MQLARVHGAAWCRVHAACMRLVVPHAAERRMPTERHCMQAGGGPTVAEVYEKPVFQVKDLPGITDPLGFFDPMGFTEDASEGKVRAQ